MREDSHPIKSLSIVLNPFTHDSRVLRAVQTQASNGYEVHIFALHDGNLPLEERQPLFFLRRFKLTTREWSKHKLVQLVKYGECTLRMVWAGIRVNPAVVHANDLSALLIGYLIARFTGAKLIYDAHELWSDPSHRDMFPRWLFNLCVRVERALARRADAVITVSESIAIHMARTMRIPRPTVVRNLPLLREEPCDKANDYHPLQRALGIADGTPIILYHGVIGRNRGIEILLDAMQWVAPPTVAVFLGNGPGPYLDDLKQRAMQLGLSDRIYFHPAVPPSDLWHYIADGTLGVAPIEGSCLSYKYCLPNKLFEYLQVGLPVVVSDLPEMASLVKHYGVGETFPDGDANALAATLNRLLSSPDRLVRYRQLALKAAKELHWGQEELRLLSVYQRVLSGGK